jgi:hypothetical protein
MPEPNDPEQAQPLLCLVPTGGREPFGPIGSLFCASTCLKQLPSKLTGLRHFVAVSTHLSKSLPKYFNDLRDLPQDWRGVCFHPHPLPPMYTQFHPRSPNVTQGRGPRHARFSRGGGGRLRDRLKGRKHAKSQLWAKCPNASCGFSKITLPGRLGGSEELESQHSRRLAYRAIFAFASGELCPQIVLQV